jgi:dienelactone hydrolase
MRPLEILSLCAALALVLRLCLNVSEPEYDRWFALVMAALALHALVEGMHWQLAPLYFTGLALAVAPLFSHHWSRSGSRGLGYFGLVLICAALACVYTLPMFRLPQPTGSNSPGTRVFYLVDQSRDEKGGHSLPGQRELMVQVWYPAEPHGESRAVYRNTKDTDLRSSYLSVLRTHSLLDARVAKTKAPWPLLIFSHSWRGRRMQNTYQMEELASHGFVVASIDHTYLGGMVSLPDGRVIPRSPEPDIGVLTGRTKEQELAMGNKYTRVEADDISFVLEKLQTMNGEVASPWYGTMDFGRVGAFGHSFGGSAALQAAYQDRRIRACLNMDGGVFGDVPAHWLAKPMMLIYGGDGTLPVAQLHSPIAADRLDAELDIENAEALERSLRAHGGYRLFLRGAFHWNFTDRSLYSPFRVLTGSGPIDPVRAHMIVNRYTLAFFRKTLLGTNEPLLEQHNLSDFPEVRAEIWN